MSTLWLEQCWKFSTYQFLELFDLFLIKEPDQSLYKAALESLRTQIRSSTTSMTSVPKPLKFLRPHYEPLMEVYEKIKDQETKV